MIIFLPLRIFHKIGGAMVNRIIYLALIASFLLTSCKQIDKETLRVGVMSSMDFVPLAVARDMGFFEKHQVKVDIRKFYSANDRDAAFQSNNIDGTVIDYTGAVLQNEGGVDLKITSACHAPFCMMTSAVSGVNSLKDLQGKKVAVSRNTVIDFCLEMALKSVDLNEGDVVKQEVNKIPIRLEMMMRGQTDVTVLPDPFITIAESNGARKIVCMDSLNYSTTGFVFKTSVVNEKEEQLKAFYRAYNDAVAYIHSHSVEALYPILIRDIGFSENLLPGVRLPLYTPAAMPKMRDILATVEWLEAKGLIKAGYQAGDLLDDRFIVQ